MPLPSLQRLAVAAQVSLVTMWKAVAVLKARGILRAYRGGRITVAAGAPLPPPSPSRFKWDEARESLLKDLAAGRFAAGTRLPDAADLRMRYAVSHPTLRKSLRALAASGDLEPDGKGYRIPARRGASPFASVHLIALAGADGGFGVFRDQGRSFQEILEAECNQAGVGLRVHKALPGRIPSLLKALGKVEGDVGYILWPGEWTGRPETLRKLLEILDALRPRKSRIAVFDEMSHLSLPPKYLVQGRTRIFTVAAFKAGEAAGRHLLSLGHRKIAFLSPYRHLPWSYRRFEGICRSFDEAGLPGRVVPFSLQHDRIYNRVYQWGGFSEAEDGEPVEWMSRYLRRYLPEKTVAIRAAEGALRTRVLPRLSLELRFKLLYHLFEEQVNQELEPLFRQAGLDREITAWVGANDATALAAFRFLSGLGKRIPKDISVSGFDNTAASFEEDLTTYHFDLTRFPGRMLRFLLDAPSRSGSSEGGRWEMEGTLIARRSTGAPEKPKPADPPGRSRSARPGFPRSR